MNLESSETEKGIDFSNYQPTFFKRYNEVIFPKLLEKFGNVHKVPKLDHIVLTSAISNLRYDTAMIKKLYNYLYLMTGLRPVYTKSRRSIAQFKLRQGDILGCKVMLRRFYMYEFLERLIKIYLPSIRKFHGIGYSSINKNTLNIGIQSLQTIRELGPYIGIEEIGCTITLVVRNTYNEEEVYNFLKYFDLPIFKE